MSQISQYLAPFNHLVMHDCLCEAEFKQLCEISEGRKSQLSQQSSYSAGISTFKPDDIIAMPRLHSREWQEGLASALGVTVTGELDAAFHTHEPGSPSGWLHNDYNPGWFDNAAEPGQTQLSYTSKGCNYKAALDEYERPAVLRIRAVAIILFLNNSFTHNSQGGHTLLADSARWPSARDRRIAPQPNTLVAFECSPISWHAFQATSIRRSSVMMWLHRTPESAKAQWKDHEFVTWQ